MPQIAQQDYIIIPISIEGGEVLALPQNTQNRLVQLAKDGRGLDVVFMEKLNTNNSISYYRPLVIDFYIVDNVSMADFYIYNSASDVHISVDCVYREITDESEQDAQ